MNQTLYLLFLLLPLAAFSGWLIGRRHRQGKDDRACREISANYIKGLNYLLDNQDDKAIDHFLHISKDEDVAAELHFILASLYKKRGEMEHAIRIHQHLLANPRLEKSHHLQALYELATDYQKAGLFDRSESIFLDLHQEEELGHRANQHLLQIYQQEKEWEKAIAIAKIVVVTQPEMVTNLAHFYCELAETSFRNGESGQAADHLHQALNFDPKCARASLLQGKKFQSHREFKAALTCYKKLEQQQPQLLPQVFPAIQQCYRQLNDDSSMVLYFQQIIDKHSDLAMVDSIIRLDGFQRMQGELNSTISKFFQRYPSLSGIHYLAHSITDGGSESDVKVMFEQISKMTTQLSEEDHHYLCSSCGFNSKSFYWGCPSCKSWSTILPALSVNPRIDYSQPF